MFVGLPNTPVGCRRIEHDGTPLAHERRQMITLGLYRHVVGRPEIELAEALRIVFRDDGHGGHHSDEREDTIK